MACRFLQRDQEIREDFFLFPAVKVPVRLHGDAVPPADRLDVVKIKRDIPLKPVEMTTPYLIEQ
ncbi:MAG TPA: hypothetical protein DCS43_07335 [Verrucomicrobia bacterium]|nr:hypothetical protein [Verrucomicrobiota bacterium]